MTRSWITVCSSEPCTICGKTDWCRRSADGRTQICRRINRGDGKTRTDKSGATFWVHGSDEMPPAVTDRVLPPSPGTTPCQRAEDADLGRVHTALIGRLDLTAAHRAKLGERGLADEHIARLQFRSMPSKGRSKIAKALLDRFEMDLLQRVPGFGWQHGRHGAYPTIYGATGLLIPVRNARGQIVALKARADDPGKGPKYSYVSSMKHGGPGPGAPDHFPLGWEALTGPLRFTEGEIKADFAMARTGIATVGVAGVGRFVGAIGDLADATRPILLAPDADVFTNPHVARSVLEALQKARERGIEIAVETWDSADGKGIDDVLANGGQIRVLVAEELDAFEQKLRDLLGVTCDPKLDGLVGEPAEELEGGIVPLGQRDPRTGRLVISPKRTLPTAEAFVREKWTSGGLRTIHDFGGVFYGWQENRYAEAERSFISSTLLPWLHEALRYIKHKDGDLELVDFESNPSTVNAALESIQHHVHLPAATVAPSWLDGVQDRPVANEVLCCRTKNLHLPSGTVFDPSPAMFSFNALSFDYDPNAPAPSRWLQFLAQIFGDDIESIQTLQQWFGYCLISETAQQKMLLIVGPRRAGKGTIARVLRELIGTSNVVSPTVTGLAGTFGLQPLIGKSLAIVSDARFAGEHVMTVVERLLCISGEDAITIDRKYLGAVTMKLPTRFVFLTNELPRFTDASTALAGRFLVLKLTRSFYGQENISLTEELLAELPGILNWAIEGWRNLRAKGRFVEPESSRTAITDIEDLSSPVQAFVREQCALGPHHRIGVPSLYAAWQRWCESDGRTTSTSKQIFGRDLAAAFPGIARRRSTGYASFYEGITLSSEPPPDDAPTDGLTRTDATVPIVSPARAGASARAGAQEQEQEHVRDGEPADNANCRVSARQRVSGDKSEWANGRQMDEREGEPPLDPDYFEQLLDVAEHAANGECQP